MPKSASDILAHAKQDKVHFLRLQFTDIDGIIKNVEVPESQFQKALDGQIMFDGSSIEGFTRIEDGTPDFRVAFELVFRGNSSAQTVPKGGGADPMARSYGGSTPSGSLTITMLDPRTSEALWIGQVAEFKVTAVEPQKQLNNAVWRVLVEFPPITG